jgi:hypothetical protein
MAAPDQRGEKSLNLWYNRNHLGFIVYPLCQFFPPFYPRTRGRQFRIVAGNPSVYFRPLLRHQDNLQDQRKNYLKHYCFHFSLPGRRLLAAVRLGRGIGPALNYLNTYNHKKPNQFRKTKNKMASPFRFRLSSANHLAVPPFPHIYSLAHGGVIGFLARQYYRNYIYNHFLLSFFSPNEVEKPTNRLKKWNHLGRHFRRHFARDQYPQ